MNITNIILQIIYRYNDLDSSSISILHIDRQLIENVFEFKSQLNEIGVRCECTIKVHGAGAAESRDEKGVVWIRIQSKQSNSRIDAIKLINELTGNACKEVSFLFLLLINFGIF